MDSKMNLKIIRKPELFARIQLSDVTIWRLEKAGRFPGRIKLGSGSVGWFSHEIDDWLKKKAEERQGRGAIPIQAI